MLRLTSTSVGTPESDGIGLGRDVRFGDAGRRRGRARERARARRGGLPPRSDASQHVSLDKVECGARTSEVGSQLEGIAL